jgi:hypothetical protein
MTGEVLLQEYETLDEMCHGAAGDDRGIDEACDERNRLDAILFAKGYCFVSIGSTGRWEKGPASKWRRESILCGG